jgi:hypothetical protein
MLGLIPIRATQAQDVSEGGLVSPVQGVEGNDIVLRAGVGRLTQPHRLGCHPHLQRTHTNVVVGTSANTGCLISGTRCSVLTAARLRGVGLFS